MYKKAIERAPNFLPAHSQLVATYIYLAREDEARAEAEEVLKINPKFSLKGRSERFPTFPDSKYCG